MKKRILIIDDSKTFHVFIKEMLGEAFLLNHVLDPREAVEMAMELQPDLFLIDLEMPYIDGLELSKILTNHDKLSSIPVIIMTSSFSDELYLEAIEAGASDILPKTSSASTVKNKIVSIIRQKKLFQQEIELKQLDAIKALIATSNHEFNNALFISEGFIKKSLKSIDKSDPGYRNLEKIKKMNDRMLEVVKKLSEISKVEIDENENKISMLKI